MSAKSPSYDEMLSLDQRKTIRGMSVDLLGGNMFEGMGGNVEKI